MVVVILTLCLQLWFGNVNCWIRQPIGPELCKRQCCIMVGSALCAYELQLMKCLPTTGNKEAKSNLDDTMLNYNQTCDFPNIKQYSNCTQMVPTRTKGTICTKQSSHGSVMMSSRRNIRLLMTDFNKNDFSNPVQLNMFDQSVTGYEFIESRFVTALAYLKDIKKLFVVSDTPSVIESYSLNKYDNKLLLRKSDNLTITFLISEDTMVPYKLYFCTNQNVLFKMTATGTRKLMISLGGNNGIFGIALDPYKKILYLCRGSHMLLVSVGGIRGRLKQTLLKSKTALYEAVSFSKVDKSLYYSNDFDVMKLTGKKSSKVQSMAQPVRRISVHGECIYVSYRHMNHGQLSEIHIGTGKHKLIDLSSRFSSQFVFTVVD